ncbi:MAG: hypothetical protein WBI44_09650 [Syntrophaceticus sp.]
MPFFVTAAAAAFVMPTSVMPTSVIGTHQCDAHQVNDFAVLAVFALR